MPLIIYFAPAQSRSSPFHDVDKIPQTDDVVIARLPLSSVSHKKRKVDDDDVPTQKTLIDLRAISLGLGLFLPWRYKDGA